LSCSNLPRVGDAAGQRAGGGGGGAGQIDFRIHMPHASHKVAVGGGDAALAFGQDAHIAAQAGPAGGGGDDAARINEGGGVAAQNALPVDGHRGGDDDGPYPLGDVPAVEDLVGGLH